MSAVAQVEGLSRSYARGASRVDALREVSLSITTGQLTAIMGPSGSGKSTLLQLMGGLDRPTAGRVVLGGQPIESLGDGELSAFRRRKLGFIFQFFHLLPTMSAEENVMLPLLVDGRGDARGRTRARELLTDMGLQDRFSHRPHQLSGGEMQRVAIARALIADPLLVLADEPTGNLDSTTGASVLELLARLTRERNLTCVMVTHDPRAARAATRVVLLRDGAIERDGAPSELLPPAA